MERKRMRSSEHTQFRIAARDGVATITMSPGLGWLSIGLRLPELRWKQKSDIADKPPHRPVT